MARKRKEVFTERCMSEGGARNMIKYLTENLGHTIVGLRTPKENEDHWYVITYTKEEKK
jgi:hypothetical protein